MKARRASPRSPVRSGTLDGPVAAVELWPPLAVQATWWAEPLSRAQPLVIVSSTDHILAASLDALDAGVRPGQTIAQARLLCPGAAVHLQDRGAATELWARALAALISVSPIVEAGDSSSGTAYLDLRGLQRLWGDQQAIAALALAALRQQGISGRAGAGPSRAVAHALAQRMTVAGPQALEGSAAQAFLDALSLSDPLFALDPLLVDDLRTMGITRAAGLASLTRNNVALRLGPAAVAAWQIASAQPEPPLVAWVEPPQIAAEERFEGEAIEDRTMVEHLVVTLAARLGAQLVEARQAASHVVLTLICEQDVPYLRTLHLSPAAQTTVELIAAGRELWRLMQPATPVEHVTVSASGLVPVTLLQHGIFQDVARDPASTRQARLARVLETFTAQHGADQVQTLRRHARVPDRWIVEDWRPGERRR